MSDSIKVFGNVGSPYTQKILALLRYRNIPYTVSWGDVVQNLSLLGIDPPKPVLLPTMVFSNGDNIISGDNKKNPKTDTTPIIRELEDIYDDKSVIPLSPVLSFLNYLLEDFADEWTTKYMFHYRWHFDQDAENAKKMLVLQHKINIDDESMEQFSDIIANRQINRLWVVGSNSDTAGLIDQSYKRYLSLMEKHLKCLPFMFGQRPSSSDFALYGQLTQLVGFDPTPRNIAYQISPRTVSWVNVMSDLSGLHDSGGIGEFFGVQNKKKDNNKLNYFEDDDYGWIDTNNIPNSLIEIFNEVGKVYIPCLIANAKAYEKGDEIWETSIDGALWKQKTFPYQAKCLNWIKDEFNKLSADDKKTTLNLISGSGCEKILD
jgi:glutathione S-transferase